MTHSFSVSDYLLQRLAEAGVKHLFGVPGDYNLHFLDHVIAHDTITWVGNANELNAAYAADGYARINGIGALLTTFGAGELSAINGIAGSYAEHVPVIHVVGSPTRAAQAAGALMHHTLGDGDFGHFIRAQSALTAAQASLTAANAPAEIDRVIVTALRERRPGYLVMPADVAAAPAVAPTTPLVLPVPVASEHVQDAFTTHARAVLADARTATVLADFLVARFGAVEQLSRLVSASCLPYSTLAMGKGLLDENAPNFVGIYSGRTSDAAVLEAVEHADALITIGVRFADTITTGFSMNIDPCRVIDIRPHDAWIRGVHYAPLPMAVAVAAITELVTELARDFSRPPDSTRPPLHAEDRSAPLSQDEMWPLVEDFMRPGDIVVADQGTSYFGAATLRLPPDTTFIGQPLWGSIGYSVPAAFGAMTAAPDRRVLLLVGDGSALLTAQEFGSMIRDGHHPVIVLINNGGYTVERAIHGAHQRYNDIAAWDWSLIPRAMGAEDAVTVRVSTRGELVDALAAAGDSRRLVLIDAVLPQLDVPELLAQVTQALEVADSAVA